MPLSPQHKTQRSKNFTLMAILLAVVGILFAMTMIRVGG